ncbi:MAG TPA: hypothetical protein VJ302_25325, partial [Blastocatellia bacterium]|nr:hypothetical protein [Blastocatellia bacterium]
MALDEDRLIKAGRSAKEVHAAANAAGVPHALIVLVEPPDTPPYASPIMRELTLDAKCVRS